VSDFDPDIPAAALDGPLPLWEAATYSGVPPATIRQWKARGRITPAGLDEFGRPMYLLVDVWRAQDGAVATRRASRTA
jgi:hypothetical protein